MPPVTEVFGPGRLAAAVVIAAAGFLSLRPAVDADYGWHIANGRHLADGVLLGGVDVYSWTAAGARWVAHEWTTEAAMAALHDAVGPVANTVVAACVVAAAIGLVVVRLRFRGFPWLATLASAALAFAASLVSIGVRPQMLELLYLAAALLWLDLRVARRIGRTAFLLGVALGAVVWANSHGSFPLLAGTLGVAATVAALLRGPFRGELALATVLAAALPLLNPWGPELYAFAVQSLSSSTTQVLIEEWRPPALSEPSFLPFTLELLLAAAGVALTLRALRRGAERDRVPAFDLAITLVIAVLALRSGRHVMLFGFVAAPLLATAIAAAQRELASRLPRRRMSERGGTAIDARGRDVINAVVFAAVAVALAIAGWAFVNPAAQERALEARYPVALLPQLDDAAADLDPPRLLNEYTWGGFLILHRPDIPVFIDGRSEVYGDPQLERYASLTRLDGDWERQLEALGVNVALLPADAALSHALRAAGWRQHAADGLAVVLLRP